MPKTTFQRVVFTLIGVIFMASTMSIYNKVLVMGDFTVETLRQAAFAFIQRAPIAFILQFFFIQKFAGKMTAKYTSSSDNHILITTIRTGFTVLLMCPIMSLYSNIIYTGISVDLIFKWLPKMVLNWPFAFLVQIFLLGPWNRFLFRKIFRNNNNSKKILTEEKAFQS